MDAGTILERVQAQELKPPFDRRAAPAYALLALQLALGLLLTRLLGFTVAGEIWRAAWLWPVCLLAGLLLRRLDWPRWATMLECTGLIYAQAWASFLVLIPLAAISAPFADAGLAWADRLIGFDFLAYAAALRPWVTPLAWIYASYHVQPFVLVAWLCATGRLDRCWQLLAAGGFALLITCAVFPFFPAEGPFVHYGIAEYGPLRAPWQFGPVLHAIKHGAHVIDLSLLTGLVSMPSYHAAAALLFTWAARRTRLVWLFVPLNLGLLLATPVIGSHYLVDLLAGLVVGGTGIVLARAHWWRGWTPA